MCGIAGIFGPDPEQFDIKGMINIMRHRGPDAAGYYKSVGVVLGHCRLSILDLTEAGTQPMGIPGRDIWIAFNGEIYNYVELREELRSEFEFRTKTDTEVLLRAYEKWGIACLDRLNGMFAFVLWDNRKKLLFCARDRLGIKPLYYCYYKNHFFFASEIKALYFSGMPREADESVIFDYLYYGYYEHKDQTFFSGIRKLGPAHSLTIRADGKADINRYWDVSTHAVAIEASESDIEEEFLSLLDQTIVMQCRSDVPVGISLSGGLDSSVLLALTSKRFGDSIQCFSYVFNEQGYDESAALERLTNELGVKIHLSSTSPDEFWNDIGRMTWYEEEPYGGLPTAAFVNMYDEAVRQKVVVLLDGNGFDELLGGYSTHYIAFLKELYVNDYSAAERELRSYCDRKGVASKDMMKMMNGSDFDSLLTFATDATLPVCRECLDDAFVEEYIREPLHLELPFSESFRKLMYKDLRYVKLPRGLRFNDRVSMRFSRELRVPFLDHRLVEFCYGLPPSMLFRDGMGKYLLRKVALRLLPFRIVNAPKVYVQNPQREWIKMQLSERVEEVINSSSFKTRPFYNHKRVLETYREYCSGEKYHNSFFIWQWLNMEYWMQLFIDPVVLNVESPVSVSG